jgi:prepilin-type N-terminal cleavage/methylation domain-containing protein
MLILEQFVARHLKSAASGSSRRRGFTLIELLVALVLLNVGLVALVALSAALTRVGDDTRAVARAYRLASSHLERMASLPCATAVAGTSTPSAGISESFGDTPAPNDTRLLRDSVAFAVPGRWRNIVMETRARC